MLNSPVDVAILFGVALLIFGPKRLPELGKSLGQGIGNFKKSLQDAQDEVKNAVKSDPNVATAAAGGRPEDGASLVPPAANVQTTDEAAGSPGR